jgi:potassium voltage-gated channel Eag-related subfamily H protein 8
MKKIWNMIRRITGKPTTASINHLKANGVTIEQPTDIANSLASTIAFNSSSDHYTDTFQRYKAQQERLTIKFTSDNLESYNVPFSLTELQIALHKAHDSAAGPDNVHYQMLKHLPKIAQSTLLHVFNDLWLRGKFPESWSNATIIPIAKPGKDPTSPGNYRPIALTSCVCKTFERMVNDRLMWYLESNNILTEYQSGFRRQRNTTDQLVRLES